MTVALVIATHRRHELLKRTLASVQAAVLPSELREIYILENDNEPSSDVTSFFPGLPLVYRFFPEGNKSRSLNWLLPELSGKHLIFLDDDVLVPPCLFSRYCEAFKISKSPQDGKAIAFWGGAVVPDFEMAPPDWLLKKLPRSVTGWNLAEISKPVDQPDFLGCNWAASAAALSHVNGFDESRGPGGNTTCLGQEYSAQRRMLDAGYIGMYISGKPVQHHVPFDRCSPEWALQRAEMNGRGFGIRYGERFGRWIRYPALLRLAIARIRLPADADSNHEIDFSRLYDVHRWRGFVDGIVDQWI